MTSKRSPALDVVCVGGAAVDHFYRLVAPAIRGTSNPARRRSGHGGVARNVAESLARLGVRCGLVTAVGDDQAGNALRDHAAALGIDVSDLSVEPGAATAAYVAVLSPAGALELGLADMAVLDALTPDRLALAASLPAARWVFADCNLSADALAALARILRRGAGRLAVDAVSVAKAGRLATVLPSIDLLFLNRDEAAALLPGHAAADDAALAAQLAAAGPRAVVLTLGARGATIACGGEIRTIPAAPARVTDATGAGDALIAATLARLVAGDPLVEAVRIGTVAAALVLETLGAVRADLSAELLRASLARRAPLSWPRS